MDDDREGSTQSQSCTHTKKPAESVRKLKNLQGGENRKPKEGSINGRVSTNRLPQTPIRCHLVLFR